MKQIKVFLIDRISLTLKIRAVVATYSRAFIPIEAKPAQSIVNYLNRLVSLTALVGVLNPQQKCPLVVAREEPIKERSPRAANMQEAGRRRREANPDGRTHCGLQCITIKGLNKLYFREVQPISLLYE